MVDIYLKAGEANPSDIKLVDPTQPLGMGARSCALAVTEMQDIPALTTGVRISGAFGIVEGQDVPFLAASARVAGYLDSIEVPESMGVQAAAIVSGAMVALEQEDLFEFTAQVQAGGERSCVLGVVEAQDIIETQATIVKVVSKVSAFGGFRRRRKEKAEPIIIPARAISLKVIERQDSAEMAVSVKIESKSIMNERPDRVSIKIAIDWAKMRRIRDEKDLMDFFLAA